jgi:hypothetical protein
MSFEDVVRIAAIADMDRHGIPVGTGAELLTKVQNRFLEAVRTEDGKGKILTITASGPHVGSEDVGLKFLMHLGTSRDMQQVTIFTVLHIGALVANVRRALQGSAKDEIG